MGETLSERFWSKVEKTDDCWIWSAYRNKKGYGQFRHLGGVVFAHRLAYELLIGPIPDGYQIDHLCHTNSSTCPGGPSCLHRACVNPDHLEAVTIWENIRRCDPGKVQRSKTHCPQGHEYVGYNIKRGGGKRHCRECHNNRQRLARAAIRQGIPRA